MVDSGWLQGVPPPNPSLRTTRPSGTTLPHRRDNMCFPGSSPSFRGHKQASKKGHWIGLQQGHWELWVGLLRSAGDVQRRVDGRRVRRNQDFPPEELSLGDVKGDSAGDEGAGIRMGMGMTGGG